MEREDKLREYQRLWAREWRRKNPERARKAQLRWRERHPERYREKYLKYQRNNREKCRAFSRAWYAKNKDHVREYQRDPEIQRRMRQASRRCHERSWSVRFVWRLRQFGHCQHCRIDDPEVLTFHHRDPETKSFGIAELRIPIVRKKHLSHREREVLKAEIRKCSLLCRNCHCKEELRLARLRRA